MTSSAILYIHRSAFITQHLLAQPASVGNVALSTQNPEGYYVFR